MSKEHYEKHWTYKDNRCINCHKKLEEHELYNLLINTKHNIKGKICIECTHRDAARILRIKSLQLDIGIKDMQSAEIVVSAETRAIACI